MRRPSWNVSKRIPGSPRNGVREHFRGDSRGSRGRGTQAPPESGRDTRETRPQGYAWGKKAGDDDETRKALEENIASLEGGIDCRATCTGMAAITTVMHLFQPGDHILAGHDIYGGTYRLFAKVFTDMGLKFSFVPMGDLEAVRKAVTPATKCLWIETPSNPLLRITDITEISRRSQAQGAIVVADNTFLSPGWQQPLALGADYSVAATGVVTFPAKDLADPARQLPRAMTIAIGLATAIYVAVALGVFGTLSVDEVVASGPTAIAVAAQPVLGDAGYRG